jgi:hypothetical protein
MTLPPLSTRSLQAALENKRHADATLRWMQSFIPVTPVAARRDIPVARPRRG